MTANIARWLPERALERGASAAVVIARTGATYSFQELNAASDQAARGLQQLGAAPGQRIALMVPPGYPFFVLTFALFKLGAIPVLIDPGMGLHGLRNCLAEADPDWFIGSTKAQIARLLLGWCRGRKLGVIHVGPSIGIGTSYTRLLRLSASGGAVLAEVDSEAMAAILFTSGSTGPAKGAIYTHGMFQEQVRVLQEELRIEPGEVDLCTFPLFALFAPALGMTAIVPDMDATRPAKADPRKLVAAIERYRATNVFGSPALIRVLGTHCERTNTRLPTLRRALSAGAPVPARVIETMSHALAPGVQLLTPYGATECLPVALIGSDEILGETRSATDRGEGICVGRPVGRARVRVIDVTHEPMATLPAGLPVGRRGEIAVAGPMVSQSYWRRPEADAVHKVRDLDTVWHRTGDIGYFDDQGRLWFCGRKAHRVITSAGDVLDTIPVEAVFNTLPWVARSALVGVRGRAVVCVELSRTLPADHASQLLDVAARFPHISRISEFLIYSGSFPVDIRHNAKIFREKLAVWAAGRVA